MKKLTLYCAAICFILVAVSDLALAADETKRRGLKVEAVRNRLFRKAGHHELTPTIWMSTNDVFYQNYLLGISYGYHLAPWVSVGLTGGYILHMDTALTKKLKDPKGAYNVTPDVRKVTFLVGAEGRLAPVYGKLNVFSEAVVHFDLFFLATAGILGTKGPEVTNPNDSGIHFFAGGGLGQRYFMPLKWLAFRWEFKILWFQEEFKKEGVDTGETRNRLDMSISLGFSFFL